MSTKTIKLHKYQDKAIFGPERFKALVAGLQSGKTMAGCVWSRMKFDEFPQDSGLICAPTHKILEQSTLPKFFEINPDLKRFYRKQESCIELPNRGIIYIRSTDNPNVIEGMTLRWIWADEAGQMKLAAWVNFQGRLSILEGELLCTTTPYTMNWLYNQFYKEWQKGNKDYLVVQFRSKDNPYFPEAEYERVKATMDGRTFRRRYDGLFEKMEGLVYEDFAPSLHVIDPVNMEWKEVIAGIDWGFTNEAAIAVIGLGPDNAFYVIDEYYQSGRTTSEIIERLKYYQKKYRIRFFYPDPAEPDRLEEMKRKGIFPREVLKGKDSITRGIDEVRSLIRENRLFVFKHCVNFVDEMASYHYPMELDDDINDKEIPVAVDNHLMDASRYALMTYQPMRVIPKKTKSYIPNNTITGY